MLDGGGARAPIQSDSPPDSAGTLGVEMKCGETEKIGGLCGGRGLKRDEESRNDGYLGRDTDQERRNERGFGVLEMFHTRAAQYSSHSSHVAPEHFKCGYIRMERY